MTMAEIKTIAIMINMQKLNLFHSYMYFIIAIRQTMY